MFDKKHCALLSFPGVGFFETLRLDSLIPQRAVSKPPIFSITPLTKVLMIHPVEPPDKKTFS